MDLLKELAPPDKVNFGEETLIAAFSGPVTDRTPGWHFRPSQADGQGMSYAAFEGYYPDRGGKLYGDPVSLRKSPGEAADYRLTFTGKTPGSAYAGVEWFGDDAEIQVQPDNNDGVRGNEFKPYVITLHAEPQTTKASIFFMTGDGVEVNNIRLERISVSAAAAECDAVYARMQPLFYSPPQSVSALLPRTAEALESGKPWRIVMLGDSIVNDTCNSVFGALLKREYPQSRVEIICSVRGSTGCWYYREEQNFRQYVADKKPDLLIIGGISNDVQGAVDGIAAIEQVIQMAKAKIGCEILLLSPGYSYDTRPVDARNSAAPIPPLKWQPADDKQKFMLRERNLAARLRIPFLDATTPAYEYVYASGKPFHHFNRDEVHSNIMGKQINGRILQRFLSRRGKCECKGTMGKSSVSEPGLQPVTERTTGR